MSDIKDTLKEATKDLLTEETLNGIQTAFDQAVEDKVSLHVEKALIEQDEDHAVKLEKLLEAVDTDHTDKLKSIVSAIDKNHSQKLKAVVHKYTNTLNEEANQFKDSVVDNISNYIELYIDDVIPVEDIKSAMENKHAANKLAQMRQDLAVDSAMTTTVVREAVVDGKKQIEQKSKEVETLNEQNQKLKSILLKTKSDLLMEQMTQELPENKRKYMYKVLGEKSPEFITENFDYTLKLLEKTEEDRLEKYQREAKSNRKVKVDRPTTKQTRVIKESAKPQQSPISESPEDPMFTHYMGELGKY